MITIIDYGLGNVLAFANVYKRLNIPVGVAKSATDLRGATKLILPGVGCLRPRDGAVAALGHAGDARRAGARACRARAGGLRRHADPRRDAARKVSCRGLAGSTGRSASSTSRAFVNGRRLPHMGWNDVKPVGPSALFAEPRVRRALLLPALLLLPLRAPRQRAGAGGVRHDVQLRGAVEATSSVCSFTPRRAITLAHGC